MTKQKPSSANAGKTHQASVTPDSGHGKKNRGRPSLTQEDMTEMRSRIASCAMRLFQEEGYEAVSMRRLAKEADCTVMTLYRYFDRKIDLLRYLWAEVFAELFEELEKRAAREETTSGRLTAVATGYVGYWLANRERYFLVFMSSGVSQPDVSVFVGDDDVTQRFLLLRQCIADVLEDGASEESIDVETQVLVCALNGIAHNLITISAYPWVEAETLVLTTLKGITSRSREPSMRG